MLDECLKYDWITHLTLALIVNITCLCAYNSKMPQFCMLYVFYSKTLKHFFLRHPVAILVWSSDLVAPFPLGLFFVKAF